MKFPTYIAIPLVFILVGCEKPSLSKVVVNFEERIKRDQKVELCNSQPTPQHVKIDSSKIGKDLDDAVEYFGPWDQVGDVISYEREQYYPFSNIEGYDYIVQVAEDNSIHGIWRRPSN